MAQPRQIEHVRSVSVTQIGVVDHSTRFGTVLRQALRDQRRAVLAIGISGALLAFWVVAAFPMFKDFEFLNQFLEIPFFSAILGDVGDYTTPQGFIGSEFFGFMPLFLAFYTVYVGLSIFSTDENTGRLDVLLSTPLPRWQLLVEKSLAVIVNYLVVLAVMFAGFVVALALSTDVDISLLRLGEGVLNLLPIMLLMTMLPLLLAVALRRVGHVAGVAGVIIIASWLVTSLSDLAPDVLGRVQALSMFTYYNSYSVLVDGLRLGDLVVLMVISAVMFALSLVLFQRRDLSV